MTRLRLSESGVATSSNQLPPQLGTPTWAPSMAASSASIAPRKPPPRFLSIEIPTDQLTDDTDLSSGIRYSPAARNWMSSQQGHSLQGMSHSHDPHASMLHHQQQLLLQQQQLLQAQAQQQQQQQYQQQYQQYYGGVAYQ
eukprot:CAMPEP_0202859354 /NCGR_PEP_ID=MMETSP1391-20130828/1506_1 /ASSEMBLY_ACC=CAM_ASM_000867 /TAXON_ID=1034604 /ORGANISM="Chlamydomonas leiostraca, Strain SAG 11-49" /LENGTH=139 /DNA_ID=CAMNT_0049538381 /DNA_START=139 /DNA_END=558 /DNA_ORIENTATION=-